MQLFMVLLIIKLFYTQMDSIYWFIIDLVYYSLFATLNLNDVLTSKNNEYYGHETPD